MAKYISVPIAWATYSIPDDMVALWGQMITTNVPYMVLESMCMNNLAKRVNVTRLLNDVEVDDDDEGDDDDDEQVELGGPWATDEGS